MDQQPQRILNCSMCFFSTAVLRRLISHYVRLHREDPNFLVRCSVAGCFATFRKWNSFKKHIQRNHRVNIQNIQENDVDVEDDIQAPVEDFDDAFNHEGADALDPQELLDRLAARFLLQIRDVCKTSEVAMKKVMDGTEEFIQSLLSVVKREIRNVADHDAGNVTLDAIDALFQDRLRGIALFEHLDTKTKFEDYLVHHMNFLCPEPIELGRGLVWKRRPVVDLVEKVYNAYCIPLLPYLKRYLENDEVRACVDNPRQGVDSFKTVLDGTYYKTHPFFSRNEKALGIILYYDEMEVTNPLGSYTHKLAMFYWTLANIYPKYRSSLRVHNLYAIAKYTDMVKFRNGNGIEAILKRFVAEIITLQTDGVIVEKNGIRKTYKGSLLMVCGDTPASAWVGGFKRSVAATKPCRRCMTHQREWGDHFQERLFTLRTLEVHNDQINDIFHPNLNAEARKFWQQHYGINSRTPLLNIPMFDVTLCLVQDCMHVLSEGVVEVATRVFLHYCVIEEQLFNIATLNERLNTFNYGHLQKPSEITRDHLNNSLRQSASQMISLAHALPFLVSDLIEDEDEEHGAAHARLLCHNRLLQIINISFAYELTEGDAGLLSDLIETFLLIFKDLYPTSMVPKFHFLVHLPQQILQFGPLRQQWCMRFEAAHAWFKNVARVVRNFTNMPWTLAYRHELLRCFELSDTPGEHSKRFLYQGHDVKSGSTMRLVDHLLAELLYPLLAHVNRETCRVTSTNEAKVHGTTYAKGSIILLECNDDELPKFGLIREIIVHEGTVILIYAACLSVQYYETLNAYLININNEEQGVVSVSDLIHPHSLSVFTFQNRKFVTLLCNSRVELIN